MKKIKYFRHDLNRIYRYKGGSSNPRYITRIRLWLFCFELHCIAAYRFDRFSRRLFEKNRILGLAPRLLGNILRTQAELFHHVVISPYIDIGPGFLIMHASNVYLGASEIGSNFTIYHNTTIGWGIPNSNSEAPEPSIGENVWIGPGSILYGKIHIGNDSSISAGSVFSKDVPEKSLISGNPGRVILNNYINPIQHFNDSI